MCNNKSLGFRRLNPSLIKWVTQHATPYRYFVTFTVIVSSSSSQTKDTVAFPFVFLALILNLASPLASVVAISGDTNTRFLPNSSIFASTISPSTRHPLLPATVTDTSLLFFVLRRMLYDDSVIDPAAHSVGVAVATGVGAIETVGVGMAGGVGVNVGVAVGDGADVGVGVTVASGVATGVAVTDGVAVGDAAGVGVTAVKLSVVKSQL